MSSQTFVDSTNACLEGFRKLLLSPVFGDEFASKQLARFNYWASNIGVFAPPRASLDIRLGHKNGANYRRLLFQLLDVLEKNLHAAAASPSGETNRDVLVVNETSQEDTLQAVADIINSLHRLSASIRKSATRDRNTKAADFVERDDEGNDINSVFREHVTRILEHRYPEASKAVCERLGESISLRRRRVLYSRRHQAKLAIRLPVPVRTQVPIPITIPEDNQVSSPITLNTAPIDQSLPDPNPVAMSVRPSETAASIPDSDTGGSTIAPSRASSASTGSMIQDQNLRYPSPPRIDPQTGEAPCPFCAAPLSKDEVLSTKTWRRHLKRDIEPFVCIAESCKGPVRFFPNFKLWSKHIQQEHRMQWHCTMATHRPVVFSSREMFENHMSREHTGKLNQSQLSTLIRRGARPATHAFDKCPLCMLQGADVSNEGDLAKGVMMNDRLSRHVAGHLKTLALMFLPPENDPTGPGTDESSASKESSRSVDADPIFNTQLTFDNDDGRGEEDYDDTEWKFLPRDDYRGHDQDPTLKVFIIRQLRINSEESEEARAIEDDQDIISSLAFDEMSYRKDTIPDAYSHTFEMIYGDISPSSNFQEWLQSGSGCYWINGKAGSGKSTLMKFIIGNSKTHESLRVWASSRVSSASVQKQLGERQPVESSIDLGNPTDTADISISLSKSGRLASIAANLGRSRSRITVVEEDPSLRQNDTNPVNEYDTWSEGGFSSPWVFPVYVMSSLKDVNGHNVPREGKCTLDTGNTQGNLASRDFVVKVLQFPASSFKPLTEREKRGGIGITGDTFIPEAAVSLTWYHNKGLRVFRDMRFLINPSPIFDLIIGAHSIHKHRLVDEPELNLTGMTPIPPLTAAYFISGFGTSLQRSESGMLRSLLYQILDASPDLIPQVFQDRPAEALQLQEKAVGSGRILEVQNLRRAFQKLLEIASNDLRMCFFIDGLDECEGFQVEDAKYLQSRSPFVKFCISSRPLVIFEDAFQNSPSLRVQDLTEPDIRLYVESTLRNNRYMAQLEHDDPVQVGSLIEDILFKANGVFLWVVLVVRSLLEGLVNGDSIMHLRGRLDEVPGNLGDLYEKMLSSISPFYKAQSSKIFQIVQNMADPYDAILVYYALSEDESIDLESGTYARNIEQVRRILQTRTAGLIELVVDDRINSPPWKTVKVSYIHRNVKTYLENSGQFHLPGFNANIALLKACVKCLDHHNGDASWNFLDYVQHLWQAACIYAKRLSNDAPNIQVQLLLEFDERATYLIPGYKRGKAKTNLHWSNYKSTESWEMDFVCALVEAHLWLPLRRKLQENPSRARGKTGQPPLLAFAFLFTGRTEFATEMPSLAKVLAVLFEFGVNPNETFRGNTMWEYFITMLHASAPCHQSEVEGIFRMFLNAGANPNATCIPGILSNWESIWDINVREQVKGPLTDRTIAGISIERLKHHSSTHFVNADTGTHMVPSDPHGLSAIVRDVCQGLPSDHNTPKVLHELISLNRVGYTPVTSLALDNMAYEGTSQLSGKTGLSKSSSADHDITASPHFTPAAHPIEYHDSKKPTEELETPPRTSRLFSREIFSSIADRFRPASGSKWPDAELSIGRFLGPMGSYQCWEAVGPALDLYNELQPQIRAALESIISIGELGPDASLVYNIIMSGKNQSTARPTILICSSSKAVRQGAVQLLKQSPIHDTHPGIRFADLAKMPVHV